MTWNERLAEAVLTGRFTADDKWAAGSWARCKVGEMVRQDTVPIRLVKFAVAPADDTLYDLGYVFMGAVRGDRVGEAVSLAMEIESRARDLAGVEVAPRPAGAVEPATSEVGAGR